MSNLNSSQRSETYFAELEAYRNRLHQRISAEAKKYGYTFEAVENAHRLPATQRQELQDRHAAYWREVHNLQQEHPEMTAKQVTDKLFLLKPEMPDPLEFGEYLEYARIQNILSGNKPGANRL